MDAVRQIADVVSHTITIRLPDSFLASRVEVIVLPVDDVLTGAAHAVKKRRTPPAELAGTAVLDDLISPALPADEWDSAR